MTAATWLDRWAEIAVGLTAILALLGMVGRWCRNVVHKLDAIDRAVNRQPEGEPPLVHRAKDIETAVNELRVEFDEKHTENTDRIERLEHHVIRLWEHMRHVSAVVGKIGRAMGVDVPPPPLDKPERKGWT